MPEIHRPTHVTSNPSHAAELALLVELEARWENLRAAPARTATVRSTTQDLHGMQKAYDAFRSALAAYNKRFTPPHTPELLLNTPIRLGPWCKTMRDLFARVENEPKVRCPIHLLEKGYRWADGIAARLGKDRPTRTAPPVDVAAAVRELTALGQWCDELLVVGKVA